MIYVASSWRNPYQPEVVEAIRAFGYTVFDFRHPAPGNNGFSWAQVAPDYTGEDVDFDRWHRMTVHKIARDAFHLDYDAMKQSDAGVLVLPSGRSAHLEAGYFVGARKRLIVFMVEPQVPDLMYLMANAVVNTISGVVERLDAYKVAKP